MRFDPEQEELRRTVRTLLERAAGGEVWRLLAEQVGAHALAIPEEFGGAGFSVLETHVVLEELGSALAAPGFLSTTLAAQAILAADSAEVKAEVLPGIASGRTRASVVWGGGAIQGTAERTDSGWGLTGVENHVLDGAEADLLVVPARISEHGAQTQDPRRSQAGKGETDRRLARESDADRGLAREPDARSELAQESDADRRLARELDAGGELARESVAERRLARESVADRRLARESHADRGLAREPDAGGELAQEPVADRGLAREPDARSELAQESDADRRLARELDGDGELARESVAERRLARESHAGGKPVAGSAVGLFLVSAADVVVASAETVDPGRRQARVEFRQSPARLLTTDVSVLDRILDLACVALSAEQVGAAQRAFDLTLAYAKQRVQFGRPIGSFQAVKHRLADLFTLLESARSASYAAAFAASSGYEVTVAASRAKAYCSEAFSTIAGEAIQLHGGIGITWEHPIHLYFKRAHVTSQLFGSPAWHRRRYARAVGLAA